MTQRVQAGLRFLRNGKLSYIGQLRTLHQKLEIHSDDGDLVLLTPDQFRTETVDGFIQMLVPAGDGTLKPVSNNWRERESECARNRRGKRVQILKFVDDSVNQGTRLGDIFPSLSKFCASGKLGKVPCERTLRNWRTLGKGHESMLSPAWDRCGNRYQGPDEILLKVLKEVVDVYILGDDTFTLTAAWGVVEALFDERWRIQYGADLPPRHSSRKLKNFLLAMPQSDFIKLRMDGRTARMITRVAVRTHEHGILWDCVEMDATVLDILVCDDDGKEIGRPILYAAIDVATGYPVGLHLTIQKPSTLPFVECLRFMFFPKPDDFDLKYEIKNRIEVFGKPVLMRVDNGSEFVGKAATELVQQLFGDTARCQPYTPQEKPHVERFNGTVKDHILTQNGATTSSVNNKKRTLKKGEKLFTIEQLRGSLYRFVYDKYALRVNELRSMKCRKAVAPMDIVIEMKATFTEPVPVGRDEFERSLCFKRESGALGHDGISFDGWKYHSDELGRLYGTFGPRKYAFFYSDLDALAIYVVPPDRGELVAAFEKVLEGSSVDRATAKQVRLQILADAKELNRRTFPYTLAEFRKRNEMIKSSRSRAKQARTDDMLNAAEEHTRKTMPRQKAAPPEKVIQHQMFGDDELSIIAPKGRKMGEKR